MQMIRYLQKRYASFYFYIRVRVSTYSKKLLHWLSSIGMANYSLAFSSIIMLRFYNSINPKGLSSVGNSGNNSISNTDHHAPHKKVNMWFSFPSKYWKEIEAEQKQYPGLCLYHLTKSHTTEVCSVRKEYTKAQENKKDLNTNSATKVMGQLRNIKKEMFEDAVSEEDDVQADCSNDTKEDDLHYFSRLTNHY